jgi:hypothetical protein
MFLNRLQMYLGIKIKKNVMGWEIYNEGKIKYGRRK